jgi:short-subunit dehydrogenase
VQREWDGVAVLINLAGVLDFCRFQDQDPGTLSRLLEVNVEAPMQLARAVLPGMVARGRGRIVNVGSMFGSIGFPLFAPPTPPPSSPSAAFPRLCAGSWRAPAWA